MEAANPAGTDVKIEEKPPAAPKRRRGMGHVCPPSTATHPKDRWDMYYVYMFIRRFTTLRDDIPGFFCVEDLENALLDEPGKVNYLLEQVVLRFILNLRPNTRNTSSELIPATLFSVLHELPRDKDRLRERTVFWDWDADTNLMPLKDLEGGWWGASWDLKLRILRQLVDWQLVYSASIRDVIDTAWQARVKPHKKRAENPKPAPEPGSSGSRDALLVIPIGQDKDRTRFWVADSSPRLYTSTNPWKITQVFKCVSTTVHEYTQWIDKLRMEAPPEPEEEAMLTDQKHQLHWDLIYAMEARVDEVQAEVVRTEQLRKKLAADAERAALDPQARRLRLRGRVTDHEEQERAASVKSEAFNGMSKASSVDMDGPPDTRETSPSASRAPNSDEDHDFGRDNDEEMQDDAEVDELQDDSSLNPDSDEEAGPKGRKRRRRPTPPQQKPTRISARKKPRREEPEKPNLNGTKAPNSPAKVNGTAPVPPKESQSPVPKPQPTTPTLKATKGQNTKYWFYEEDDGIPKKRPEMLDDPDAVLRRRKKAANAAAKHKANPSGDSHGELNHGEFKSEEN